MTVHHKNKLSKWSGIKGSEEATNTKEIQQLLQSSSSVLFYAYERLLAMLPAFSVLPLDLSDCVMAFLLDMVHTEKSNARQGSLDTIKK